MKNCLIFLFFIIEICCEVNKTCENCPLTKKATKLKKIFIYIGIGILIIIVLILFFAILFRKYITFYPFFNILSNHKKTKEEILIVKKKIYCLFEHILKEENYITNDEKEKCIICLEEIKINENVCYLPCKHVFHFKCLKLYFYDNLCSECPLCKYDLFTILNEKNIDFKDIVINLENETKMIEHYKRNSTEVIEPLNILIKPIQNNIIINPK